MNIKTLQSLIRYKIPMKVLALVHIDVWYATKILGWEFDRGFTGLPHDWHFHTRSGAVVRPDDYILGKRYRGVKLGFRQETLDSMENDRRQKLHKG